MVEKFYDSFIYDGRYKYIFEGLFNTLIIALFACLIGVFIGILIAIVRHNHDTNGKLKIFIIVFMKALFMMEDINIFLKDCLIL